MKMYLIAIFSLLITGMLHACPPCPSGSNTNGSGAATNLPGCKCNDPSYTWNGSLCYPPLVCPGGTSPGGPGGAASPAGCNCNTAGWTWNGSSCAAPPTCSNGSIRTSPTSGGAEVCSGGNWVPRSLNTYCHPGLEYKKDDDEWMSFNVSSYGLQNSGCTAAQRTGSGGSWLAGGGVIHYDDTTKTCLNVYSCVSNETPPSSGAGCNAITIGWAKNGYACYADLPYTGSGTSRSVSDTTPAEQGWANMYCQDGVWSASPGSCGTTYNNCQTMYGMYGDISYCGSNGSYVGSCCTMVDGYTTCDGYSPSCP